MRKYNLSLKRKALIGIIIILLPIIITFFLSYHRNKAQLKKLIINDLTVMAESYEGQVYQFLDLLKQQALDFATDGYIIRHLLKKSRESNVAVDTLSKHLAVNKLPLNDRIKAINVLTMDGKVVASTNSVEIGRDLSGEALFVRGKDATTITEINVGHGGLPELAISTPIVSKNRGKPIGVLINYILISELDKILNGEYNKEMGDPSWNKGSWKTLGVYLVNRDKRMIIYSLFTKDTASKQAINTLPVETALISDKEMSGFYKDYRGVDVAGVSMCIPSMKWVLLVEIDKDEVLVVVKDMLLTALITAVVVVGLIVLLFLMFLERVVKPLRMVSHTAKKVASGDFSTITPFQTGDEIGTLCESFNYMINHVKARTT